MCRNIRPLFNFEPPATADEITAAARQFVRKVSGFSHPSAANSAACEAAIAEISGSVERLLAELTTNAPARDRDVEAARLRVKSAQRFGTPTVRA